MTNNIGLFLVLGLLSLIIPERTTVIGPRSAGEDCPTITVDCSTGRTTPDEPYTAVVHIEGGKPDQKLTFRWTVANGTLIDGQGTLSIKVKSDGRGNLSAALKIEGLESECIREVSCSWGDG